MTKDEAIRHLCTYSSTNGSGQTTQEQHEEAKRMAIDALKQPERKGKWIWNWDRFDIDTANEAVCSKCKKISAMPVGYFCKWCGADMRGEEHEPQAR